MKKQSSYQKLKAELERQIKANKQLSKDLYNVCMKPNSLEALLVKANFNYMASLEHSVFYGEPKVNNEFNGFLPKIK